MTNPKEDNQRLANIPEEMVNQLADSFLELSEQEVLAEERALGGDPTAEADYVRSVLRQHRELGVEERVLMARELHDGAVQSLIAVEMQIDRLRRQVVGQSNPITAELGRIQGFVREEVLKLRELLQQMKALDVDAANFLHFIEDTVERFQRETGIGARFVPELDDVHMPRRVCRELARIVQEGLVNVRKHSAARDVLVRVSASNNQWHLTIEDNGRGFPFSGRFSQADLEEMGKGPMVIGERVRLIDGELTVESSPSRGSALEVNVPQSGKVVASKPPTRIVIADDHPIFRSGLRKLLETEPGLQVAGEACDGAEAVKLVRQLQPDILLLDLAMPRHPGLEALRDFSSSSQPNPVRVILLTAAAEKHQIVEALQLGARGVVLKDSATQLLLESIQTVMMGGYWVGRESVANMVQYLRTQVQASEEDARKQKYGLTPRELEIVSAVVAGYSNKEIAQYFKIAEDTVKHHMSNIFDKLGVSTRLELGLFAVNHSLPLESMPWGGCA